MTDQPPADPGLIRTSLHDVHLARSGRMVAFAGHALPVQYAAGVLKEHLHVRSSAGLFDVSHMGQYALRAKSGALRDAMLALERLLPNDVAGLGLGRQRYGLLTNTAGGLLDDLMFANRGDHLFLVVNGACATTDEAHLRAHLSEICHIERLDRALIALQGPKAELALATLAPACAAMRFMDVAGMPILGADCIVSRSGYTGEDGFEISIPTERAVEIVEALLGHSAVAPIGLGARDSLRLEAGLCLYGNDIDTTTTPIEAALNWAIPAVRRAGGARAGGFLGADVILGELANGTSRRRVGLKPEGRAPVRGGAALFAAADGGEAIGRVTSGGFGPSVDAPVAMGYVPTARSGPDQRLFADVRGKRLPITVTALPFITPRYKRG
jgi:aminomethyltransferase